MILDSQVPHEFLGEAVTMAEYLQQQILDECQTMRDARAGYTAPYVTLYKILNSHAKPEYKKLADNPLQNPINCKFAHYHLLHFG
jgi:hypothetical protein